MKYAETLAKQVILGAAVLAFAACASKPPPEPDMTKVCPPALVQTVLGNQTALSQVQRGQTNIKDLKGMGKPAKLQKLTHYGEADLVVAYFPTAIPNCPYMLPGMTFTPVILTRGDVVKGYGMDDMHDLFAKGWKAQGQTFPWQDYNYAYLPHK